MLKQRQNEDLSVLTETNTKDLDEFNALWDRKFSQFKEACTKGEEDMKTKHREELVTEGESLQQTIPVIPKHSSEILNLQKIQDTVIRQKNYKEAHRLQRRLDELSEGKHEKWVDERNERIARQLDLVRKRHESEIQNFRKKAVAGFNELKRQKAKELEALFKKYNNNKQDLANLQKLENAQIEASRRPAFDTESFTRMLNSRSALVTRIIPKGNGESTLK